MTDEELHRHLVGQQGSPCDLNTPVLLIDRDALDRNIAAMAAFAADHGLKLRPHAKTHKSPDIARRQIAAGAIGQCCAKIGEAEVLAEAGSTGMLLTSPVVSAPAIARFDRKELVIIGVGAGRGSTSSISPSPAPHSRAWRGWGAPADQRARGSTTQTCRTSIAPARRRRSTLNCSPRCARTPAATFPNSPWRWAVSRTTVYSSIERLERQGTIVGNIVPLGSDYGGRLMRAHMMIKDCPKATQATQEEIIAIPEVASLFSVAANMTR